VATEEDEEGVVGSPGNRPELEWDRFLSGDAGLRSRDDEGVMAPPPRSRLGDVLLLLLLLPPSDTTRSWSRTEIRVGDEGKASSTGFRGRRMRLGELTGLWGRSLGE